MRPHFLLWVEWKLWARVLFLLCDIVKSASTSKDSDKCCALSQNLQKVSPFWLTRRGWSFDKMSYWMWAGYSLVHTCIFSVLNDTGSLAPPDHHTRVGVSQIDANHRTWWKNKVSRCIRAASPATNHWLWSSYSTQSCCNWDTVKEISIKISTQHKKKLTYSQ